MTLSSLPVKSASDQSYQETIRRLYERVNFEKSGHARYSDANYRLDRMRKLLGFLGDPHLAAPVIHVAGTKGKGSTATFVSNLLSAAGYRTGLYTSPHLKNLEERFRLDNRPCGPAELVEIAESAQSAAARVESCGGGRATFFEITTAMSFLHFAQQKAQAVVLEVGMGGRLDSTNVCKPEVCVITSIGLDHQAQLGNSIAEIASEKAGIIKPGAEVITSARHPDALRVIREVAKEKATTLRVIDLDFACDWSAVDFSLSEEGPFVLTGRPPRLVATCRFTPGYAPSRLGPSQWQLSLLGEHQRDNLAAALATVDLLAQRGWSLPDKNLLCQAIGQTQVPARMQIVNEQPWRLIDAAHNPDSIAATLRGLAVHFGDRPQTIVFATSRDKDVESMLKLLAANPNRRLIITQYHSNPRGLPLDELESIAKQYFADGHPPLAKALCPADAWQLALETSSIDAVICATGSFFQAAELLQI